MKKGVPIYILDKEMMNPRVLDAFYNKERTGMTYDDYSNWWCLFHRPWFWQEQTEIQVVDKHRSAFICTICFKRTSPDGYLLEEK